MRIIFAGTPDTAIPSLNQLALDHEVIAVLTRAPAPVGRKRILTKSAVHIRAEELGIPVLTPASLRDQDVQHEIGELSPEAVAVVAYGLLIPPELLEVPPYGWINLHFSLLPRWRGAAPVQYAIANGDDVTGTAVFQIEKGLDTGPVFDIETYELSIEDTAEGVLDELSKSGAIQLSRVLNDIEHGKSSTTPQAGIPTFAPRFSSKDTRINWTLPAEQISAQTRGWWSAPGAWTMLSTTRVKLAPVTATSIEGLSPGQIYSEQDIYVGTATTAVKLTDVGPAGKSWMAAKDWVRGLTQKDLHFSNTEEK